MTRTTSKPTERKINWHTSNLDGGNITYRSAVDEDRPEWAIGRSLTIDKVIFERWNDAAGITEEVGVHWSNAFKWADADPCGGLKIAAVILSDGTRTFASGLYFGLAHKDEYTRENGGLAEVVVGCYGSSWLKREFRPQRNKHGFAQKPAA